MDMLLDLLNSGGSPSLSLFMEMWGEQIPLLMQVHETPQDPEWHGEGDVGIHTDMVLSEIYEMLRKEAKHITGIQRVALILGAVFHDIAKPLTTRLMCPILRPGLASALPYK